MEDASAAARAFSAMDESPAARRKRRMRDQIIEAAEHVFAAEGAEGLSMRRIAERIDYSPAAIYKYFKSKADLVCEIREMFFERLLARISSIAEQQDWTLECFRDCLRSYIETGLEQPNHYRMAWVFDEGDDGLEEGSKAYQALDHLTSMVELGMERGLLRRCPPVAAAESVWASLHGLTMLMAEHEAYPKSKACETEITREEMIAFHADCILRGLAV